MASCFNRLSANELLAHVIVYRLFQATSGTHVVYVARVTRPPADGRNVPLTRHQRIVFLIAIAAASVRR